ncbi:MAG: ABC transporter ATP-binding protein [Comamonas sp. SCN 65-56]|uniref:ABC transporter ATP-binding protein n=1 Tax=Comamonas sp. SCN 65-56 TaxID=1660095 RepID=UPI00086ED3AE|nr:ABC transporter ATP-binding protein [Comamonas sp. SCN 65-56]ODS93152.1 MAG: ABC transporter ATP-binding protein [Comamonas sp. SCN 65-56]
MNKLLEIRGLSAAYGQRPVLSDVELAVHAGGITALLGANGAGKTTTLRAICNLMVRTSGEILLAGERIDGVATEKIARLGVAHVPDGRGTFAQLTVEENLLLGAATRRDKDEIESDCERMYGYFPRLGERRAQQAGTLSGGEQQMLAVSRALMMRPRLLLLDEPSFGVAPLVVKEIFDVLRTINENDSVGILLVEQNADLALGCADHAYVLESGRIATGGPSDDIRRDEGIRRAYLGY